MLTAICRYGPRVVPETNAIVQRCRARGELIEGPDIAAFERACAETIGVEESVSTSYGRMAFYYILNALDLPAGGEVIVPALTFWVVPEMVRVAGFTPVFVDVDPRTFTLDPAALERVISARTVAVVPTHLYGLPCDMDAIVGIARKYGIAVIEDCAHALGATFRGRPVGSVGDAAFFSFQTLKPLNTYGGGLAVARDPRVLERIRVQAEAEPWPSIERVRTRLRLGWIQRTFSRPSLFTLTAYPALLAATVWKGRPDVYLWEKIRPLSPMPESYRERYTNVQAALGLAGLERLVEWTRATRAHAAIMDDALNGLSHVHTPEVPEGAGHVYYQYCVYALDRDRLVRRALWRGIDVETLHVDVCSTLSMFGSQPPTPGAAQAAQVVQLPVYASLGTPCARRVARHIRRLLASEGASGNPAAKARTDIAKV